MKDLGWTTQSLVAVVQDALAEARKSMPKFVHPLLGKDFTEQQLYAIQILRRFIRTDIRGVKEILADSAELCEALGLEAIPDYAILFLADRRMTGKGFLKEF